MQLLFSFFDVYTVVLYQPLNLLFCLMEINIHKRCSLGVCSKYSLVLQTTADLHCSDAIHRLNL